MGKIRIALLFGSVSSEHEVSRVSCATVAEGLDKEKYEAILVGITREGRWLRFFGAPEAMRDGSWEQDPRNLPFVLSADRLDHGFLQREADGSVTVVPVDVVFPVLHGRNGEDGRVPALCQLAGLPFVGCDMLASAMCMDKAVTNTMLDAAGIPRCEWMSATVDELRRRRDEVLDRAEEKLGYPLFVKPANAGSSVGVTKATSRSKLSQAVDLALAEDDKVVFERFVDGQEVECAVIGNHIVHSTLPGEILSGDEFYTYDDKYKNGVSQTLMEARLSPETRGETARLAVAAYRALGCRGLARCDFFVERGSGRVLVNEINTLPGFTSISMYPKLMEHEGVALPELLDRLISLALEETERRYG